MQFSVDHYIQNNFKHVSKPTYDHRHIHFREGCVLEYVSLYDYLKHFLLTGMIVHNNE